ncbi:hypothetical protein N7478_005378 [Penicillium angulare]|uniref:uncharacterized protein n=1 Tax=Penicillium angulare TaxID=116970 RepID=UPI00254141CB|nr:uncharacterized protein N7478_005378 [Penicillium angulare]KAJ5280006.1 hypothetical protein N7478_005378 [Penicillium angulare]
MDGDQRMKHHERLMARSRNGTTGGRGIDHFDSAMNPRGDPTGMSQAPDRSQMSYDYGYTGSSFNGGSLHPIDVPDPTEFARQRQTASQGIQHANPHQYPHPHQHQHQDASQHQQHPIQQTMQQPRRRVAQDPSPFVPYESAMLYGFGQQGPAQGPFDVVPQYPTRQSAAIEALSNPFAVPRYFTPEEQPSVTGVPALSTYLNPQMPYNQPGPIARPNTTQTFPPTMTDFTSIGTASSSRLDSQPPQHQPDPPRLPPSDPPSLEEAYSYYQRSMRITFDHVRAGRLVEASRLLLEISEWLVTHARDLGRFILFHVLI